MDIPRLGHALGNNESAGIRMPGRIRKVTRSFVELLLVQRTLFVQIAARRGSNELLLQCPQHLDHHLLHS
jgi:hypothetical protein